MQPLKIIYRPTYKFELKRARNWAFLAHQMQNFPTQADSQNHYVYLYI